MRATEPSTQDRRPIERVRDALRFSAIEIVVVAVLVLLVAGGASLAWLRSRPVALAQPGGFVAAEASGAPSGAPSVTGASIVVHVVGAVRRPGVYELAAGARGIDAVRAAGGLGPHADPLAINLAQPLTDGEQLLVPRRAPGNGAQPGGAAAADRDAAGKVNVNTADQAELETLPGIGPSLAARIIEHRDANGPFASIQDLLEVSGIGEKTLANLEPYITV